MSGDTTEVMKSMCDSDFVSVRVSGDLQNKLKHLTLEWAQDHTMWQPRSWEESCQEGNDAH